jgi:hypothetical protein
MAKIRTFGPQTASDNNGEGKNVDKIEVFRITRPGPNKGAYCIEIKNNSYGIQSELLLTIKEMSKLADILFDIVGKFYDIKEAKTETDLVVNDCIY